MTLFGTVAGWLGGHVGIMTGFLAGTAGSAIGVYVGWRINRDFFE